MTQLPLIASIAALTLAGCAHLSAQGGPPSRQQLIGAWYGNAAMVGDSGLHGDNLFVRNVDGSFVAYFRMCRNKQMERLVVETGRWDYADGIDTTTTLTVNGQHVLSDDDYFVERYRVGAEPDGRMRLVSLKGGEVFLSRRVDAPTFTLPPDPCAGTAASHEI